MKLAQNLLYFITKDTKGGGKMSKKDDIQENMESNDLFIRGMYADLYNRIKDYEETNSIVEKMKFSDAKGSIIIVGMIALFLLYVMII